jgi:hypothetical protein
MSAIDVDITSIVKGYGTVNIPLGIVTVVPPFRLHVAVIVMASPSSSAKYLAKGIFKLFPCPTDSATGTVTTLGATFVTLRVKLYVILDGNSSETVILIT